jgi:hypothetical protein
MPIHPSSCCQTVCLQQFRQCAIPWGNGLRWWPYPFASLAVGKTLCRPVGGKQRLRRAARGRRPGQHVADRWRAAINVKKSDTDLKKCQSKWSARRTHWSIEEGHSAFPQPLDATRPAPARGPSGSSQPAAAIFLFADRCRSLFILVFTLSLIVY